MFGYQQTQFNYGAYASANGQQQSFINYAQQQNNSATAPVAGNATTNAYAASQYSLAASAYAQYSQAATQQQSVAATYGVQPPPPPPDYSEPNSHWFVSQSASSTTGAYGVIGGGKATGANATSAATGANASHYTGYEAAVYAAASSYLQSKNHAPQPQGNWVNKSSGGNFNKEFRKKRYGLGHQNRDVQQHFCEVCKISCAGQAAYKDHLEGKPHKKKEMAAKNKSTVPTYKGVGFRCEVCELTCSSKDTYDAHIKGQKHQRTVALLRRMGKPVPEQLDVSPAVLTSANAQALGKPIPTVGGNVPLKKVVGVTGTKFVGGTTLTTTGEELKTGGNPANVVTGAMKPQDLEKALLADVDIKPIGQEYIEEETDTNGKFINYNCKLCDCKFSDKNAKDIHLKGRRHRLQYKQKVDPSLKVEMKQWGGKKQQQKHKFGGPGAYAMSYHPPPQQPRPFVPMQRGHEIMDDQHVVHKLQQIQLSMDEGPTGMPAVDCLNGYRSYTDCFGESCVGNQRNGNWVSNSAGGGNYNKEFRKKRYGLTHQNQAVQPQFCEVFKISCAGQAAFVSGASPARFHCQEDRPISGRHSTGSIPSRRRPSPADSVRSEPTKSLSPLNTSSISATPTRAPLNHQTFGEFKLFREQQQAIPMRLQVNHRRNIHGEYGPTGMPAVDCLNGYRSYTDRCGEFFMGDPLDPNMETDFDFAGNLALFDKAEFNRETENVFHGLDSAGDCSRNYRNDENVLQDSSRVISWTKNTTADDDDNQNNSTSSPID